MGIIVDAVLLFVQTETQLLLTKLHGVFVQWQWMADPDPLKHVPPHVFTMPYLVVLRHRV